jgi:hypothetical protein
VKRGDLVWIWFDTGAGRTGGARVLYGRVIGAGPRTYRVRWESGLTNRVAQGYGDVKVVEGSALEEAREAMARVDREHGQTTAGSDTLYLHGPWCTDSRAKR